jgi:hypothetical protein
MSYKIYGARLAIADKYDKCLRANLNMYAYEKAHQLLKRCNNEKLNPLGTVTCFQLVAYDVYRGEDGFAPHEKFPPSPISILPFEVEGFAECFRGASFASQVKEIHKRLGI